MGKLLYRQALLNHLLQEGTRKLYLWLLYWHVPLDFEFNVTVDSCMNSNLYVVDFYSLAQFARLNFFKALIPESTNSISPDPLFLCLLFFISVFLSIFKEWTRKEIEIPINGVCFYTVIPKFTFSWKNVN